MARHRRTCCFGTAAVHRRDRVLGRDGKRRAGSLGGRSLGGSLGGRLGGILSPNWLRAEQQDAESGCGEYTHDQAAAQPLTVSPLVRGLHRRWPRCRGISSASALSRMPCTITRVSFNLLGSAQPVAGRRATRHPRARRKRCEFRCVLGTRACPQPARSADYGPRAFKGGSSRKLHHSGMGGSAAW